MAGNTTEMENLMNGVSNTMTPQQVIEKKQGSYDTALPSNVDATYPKEAQTEQKQFNVSG